MNYDYARGPEDLNELKIIIEKGVRAITSSKIYSNTSKSNKPKTIKLEIEMRQT